MSPADPSSGREVSASAELRRAARDSVREWVASADAEQHAGRGWMMPLAATAVVTAAACAPVVWPLLVAAGASAGAAAAVGAALGQVGAVGGGLLSETVIRAWERLRSRGQSRAGQAELRDELAAELRESLTRDTAAAAALRDEVAGVLRGVDAIQVVVRESAADVRNVLVQELNELGKQ